MADVDRVSSASQAGTVRRRSLLRNWRLVLATCNAPPGRVDPVSRWLVLVRACAMPLTLVSAAVAGLIAVGDPLFDPALYGLAAGGVILAHAANNLMNDLFDMDVGADTKDYPRALYAPHPILSGMITRGRLLRVALVVNVVDLAILAVLFRARGWPVVAFALAGFLVSAGYAAPPLRLKKRGLGEPGVFVVWGPLMVGGAYYAATGTLPWQALGASVPFALLATAVLMGKHIDKLPWDIDRRIGTLPAMLGEAPARRLNQALMAAFYVSLAALVAARALPVASLLAFAALPRLVQVWRAYSRPRPEKPPRGYPVWPLWYASIAFVHTRRAGALFVAGLVIGVFMPW